MAAAGLVKPKQMSKAIIDRTKSFPYMIHFPFFYGGGAGVIDKPDK
jgi:hypothetical protein